MRLRVSGASPTWKESESNSVTVRQAPLTQMESPIWQSVRIGAEEERVSVKPEVEVEGEMAEMVDVCSTWDENEHLCECYRSNMDLRDL